MKKTILFFLVTTLLIACARVPVTNRKQLKLLPEAELIAMADTAYKMCLDTSNVLPASDSRSQRVKNVGTKIEKAVTNFCNSHNASNRVAGYNWQFNVIESSTVNAWCMPGGKVVVYTGILPLATDDTLLAVVMGHEIAHAIARHGNERMSQGLAVQGLGTILSGTMQDPVRRSIFLQSYGIGTSLGMLKYSRKHESEADKMGLVFMYLAGYNPWKALDFWQKMSELGGANIPEILSTHPSDATRIADIKAYLPEVKKHAE